MIFQADDKHYQGGHATALSVCGWKTLSEFGSSSAVAAVRCAGQAAAVQYSTVKYSTVQYSTVQYSTVQ